MVGNCLFHDDHHASMKVSENKQIFKCFACDAGGDMYDFSPNKATPFLRRQNSLQTAHL